MTRAEKRRAMREAGYHRSPSKKGARAPLRSVPVSSTEEAFPLLSGGGFQVVTAKDLLTK